MGACLLTNQLAFNQHEVMCQWRYPLLMSLFFYFLASQWIQEKNVSLCDKDYIKDEVATSRLLNENFYNVLWTIESP